MSMVAVYNAQKSNNGSMATSVGYAQTVEVASKIVIKLFVSNTA